MRANFLALDIGMLQGLRSNPELVEGIAFPEDDDSIGSVDVGMAWPGIQFLLEKAGFGALAKIMLGVEEIGGDLGCGPARIISPLEMRELALGFNEIGPTSLVANFSAEEMQRIPVFPENIWADREASLNYLLTNYATLREFFVDSASRGLGAVTWIV